MAIGTYMSIITLNESGLNAPTKRHRLAEWIQKQDPYICCLEDIHLRELIFQHKLCRLEGNTRIYLKYWKGKIYDQDLIQNWWRNKKLFRQAKVTRIQYHQTSLTTNIKGTYIVKKYKRRKKIYKINPKQLRKWP